MQKECGRNTLEQGTTSSTSRASPNVSTPDNGTLRLVFTAPLDVLSPVHEKLFITWLNNENLEFGGRLVEPESVK
jgi:hypothetical protein